MPRHWPTYLAVLAVATVVVLSVKPIGAKNYSYAVVETLPHVRYTKSSPAWLKMDGQRVDMRAVSFTDDVSVGDIICVTYTDAWPEGLVIRQQVSDAECDRAGAMRPL